MQVDAVTHTAAIRAGEMGLWTHALQTWQNLVACGLEVDLVSCSATISACEKHAHWHRAQHMLQKLGGVQVGGHVRTRPSSNMARSWCREFLLSLCFIRQM